MFLTYGIIAVVGKNQTLLAAQAFVSLSLVSLVTAPLIKLIFSIPTLRQAISCLERVQQFCQKDDLRADDTDSHGATEMSVLNIRDTNDQLIEFKNASISWLKDSDIVLSGLNISIPANKVTMVVGSVGSGKSLLLGSIIGETRIRQGGISNTLSHAAYCPQTP
jgi:ABC-type multidrug transport system fused ATPase/permease subunit